ncbi:MAG: hypothetical protein J7559_01400, partial [Cohnella sp.]|nr:hypothetical protein [Cohnella sp.]
AGSVLLAEMLAWFVSDIRGAAWGESYFDPQLMQDDQKRYALMHQTLHAHYGEDVAKLFRQAWESKELTQCPTFGEWYMTLMSKREAVEVDSEEVVEATPAVDSDPVPNPTASEEFEADTWDQAGLALAIELDQQGKLEHALEQYDAVWRSLPEGSPIRFEIEAAISKLRARADQANKRSRKVEPQAESVPHSEPQDEKKPEVAQEPLPLVREAKAESE